MCDSRDVALFREHVTDSVYGAIVSSTTATLEELLTHVGQPDVAVDPTAATSPPPLLAPIFAVDVELSSPDIVINPSLDEVQMAFNRIVQQLLQTSAALAERLPTPNGTTPYSQRFKSNAGLQRLSQALAGGVVALRKRLQQYLSGFNHFSTLWQSDRSDQHAAFIARNPQLDDVEAELKRFVGIEASIAAIHARDQIDCLALETAPLANSLQSEASTWKAQYAAHWHDTAFKRLQELHAFIDSCRRQLLLK